MKVVLSRKGFDSAAGGGPSPILPDGRLLSLPIPSRDTDKYSALTFKNRTYSEILSALGLGKMARSHCHVDPDIYSEIKRRPKGWRGCFGQAGAAQSHLQSNRVGPDDLFLFFGWFRQTELVNNNFRFCGPDLHVIYGYLQVDSMINLGKGERPPAWANSHPHVVEANKYNALNGLYLSRERLTFSDDCGFGTFQYTRVLTLTKIGQPARSRWELPEVFRSTSMTYHPSPWKDGYFQSASRGQEFVVDNPEVAHWAKNLIRSQAGALTGSVAG